MIIAVAGATGLVGSKMLKVLEERKVNFSKLILTASERSVGRNIPFGDKT
ncbi:aspartate-semialdehyde dehydrogenase, partial [Candidatus Dojkabacteria bacterium]|nr:aspartate-semialdehyde dehydrogenase [Candidatus Dojkabacteria bacterium]